MTLPEPPIGRWGCPVRGLPVRLSRVAIVVVLFVVVLILTHSHLSKLSLESPGAEDGIHSRKGAQMEDEESLKVADLKGRIEELMRIKVSVSDELRDLESRRQKMQSDISLLSQRMEDLKGDYTHQQVELERLRMSVEQAQYAQKEAQERSSPRVSAPLRILPRISDEALLRPLPHGKIRGCRTHLCFDYSRCSLTSGFPVYFYQTEDSSTGTDSQRHIRTAVTEALNGNIHITFDPSIACVYVVLLVGSEPKPLDTYFRSLGHWNGDGRNHLLLNLASDGDNLLKGVNTGRAIVIQSSFTTAEFRNEFDIIAPPFIDADDSKLYLYAPARRKFLLSFQGEFKKSKLVLNSRRLSSTKELAAGNDLYNSRKLSGSTFDVDFPTDDPESSESLAEDAIVDVLKKMQLSDLGDNFFFQFSCTGPSPSGLASEWLLCGTSESRLTVLEQSTFSLLIGPLDHNLLSTAQVHIRVMEALKTGSVPVILGDHLRLPFDEFLDWRRAVVMLPKARVSELHYYLRTFTDNDIMDMRHKGRLFYDNYLGSTRNIISTILATIRNRINIPPLPVRDESSPSVFNGTFRPTRVEFAAVQDPDPEENLGPVESPFPSPSFQRNFTLTDVHRYSVWNEMVDPFTLYPHTPFDPLLPSDAKFKGSSFGFRPIGQGAGGSGKEFSESLGGNWAREQFTIVMLTYEREAVLIDSLQRLRGLPYLNKVVVVWNSERLPSADLRWPEIGVPIHVIKAKKNSLNNRFLPYDVVETECILSVDDDAHLRHDEIVFGFRVWREARDRIVGFPGRFHAWDPLNGGWHYNSNYSCELSMVLTGAAFFHKYYSYLYSYSMPQTIREKVDEYMNCEDIAMNFLVSHVTRKPPLKVTSRWTFRCPGCPVSLSEEDSHFQERHKCIEHFVNAYGYMPLLNTQFRADSVLFKTRIPHDKQKCFKFI
ncbi:hypothetical protein JTE90_000912 [Oedothorax gibbosus]|uniref:glucuronosyl-galactosyl-proteoglycan 4-alpha-N-acetylglucosaminyltransferase n=1 Tax=Oedothorax gibbosus TaxID=931172 RepID=A0AAV6VVN6_9ARAC|nr:hypothetical protein JTE90_000912 [Oedothorax gibbosus]